MESQPGTKGHHKAKNSKKTTNKSKIPKKTKKAEGATCSMFLADLTRKLQMKRKHEEDVEISKNIVHGLIDAIASVTITVNKKQPVEKPETPAPVNIEQLQTLAPELIPRDTIDIPNLPKCEDRTACDYTVNEVSELVILGDDCVKTGFKVPKMPVVTSDVMKPKPRTLGSMHDMAVNTGGEHDVASEIAKYVGTLKKISLIAEEFNQKTAKNLKEIVDSVQEDLIKKLEELQAEQRKKVADALAMAAAREAEEDMLEMATEESTAD